MGSISEISLDGGCICFDFINTVSDRTQVPVKDYIHTYADILLWSERVNILSKSDKDRLKSIGTKELYDHIVDKAREIRETLYIVFSAIASNKPPSKKELNQLSLHVTNALSNLSLTFKNDHKEIDWEVIDPEYPLHRVLKSTYDIWTNSDNSRIKECGRCGWIFLDNSKNNCRKWCNMNSCGSSDKSLRYYYRQKKKNKS